MSMDLTTKVLVVDDMLTMRHIIKNILREIGFKNIVDADDGIPAWEKIQEASSSGSPFGLIISDWNMPGMLGIDLLKKVRSTEDVKSTPFLMLTAETEQENIIMAVQAGVSNYVIKPFNRNTLEEKLNLVFK